MLRRLAYSAVAALSLGTVLASPEKDLSPVQVLETRRHARSLERDAWRHVQRDLVAASLLASRTSKQDVFQTNGSLELSWSNAELFS